MVIADWRDPAFRFARPPSSGDAAGRRQVTRQARDTRVSAMRLLPEIKMSVTTTFPRAGAVWHCIYEVLQQSLRLFGHQVLE